MNNQRQTGRGRWLSWSHALLLILLAAVMPCDAVFAQEDAADAAQTPVSVDETSATEMPAESSATSPGEPAQSADEATVDKDAGKPEEADPWALFFPPPDSRYDWIKLTSGEWLKGEIKGLYNYELEFESDELDDLKFDWEDVAIIRSAGLQAVGYEASSEDRRPVTVYGQLTLIGETATIGSGPDATVLRRDQIITIAKGTRKEVDLWSGEISLGANFQRGNSNLSTSNIYLLARRRSSITRFHFDYRGNFSKTEGIETSNNHRANLWFDTFRTSRLYWRVVFVEYFRDRFQNVQNQVTVGTGIGYDIIRTPRTEWDVSAGVGALYKQAVSVEANEDSANTAPSLTLGTNFDIELTSRLDYLLNYRAQITDEENGAYISHFVTTLSSDLVGELDLDLTFVWDYTAKPRPAADGTVPKKNDYGMTIAISYDF
ncbi:MAG: DUF481 domain-containing protein [Burkholderiales bacterium]